MGCAASEAIGLCRAPLKQGSVRQQISSKPPLARFPAGQLPPSGLLMLPVRSLDKSICSEAARLLVRCAARLSSSPEPWYF